MNLGRIKPGWYLLLALFIYSIIITTLLVRNNRRLAAFSDQPVAIVSQETPPVSIAPEGLWFPIPGARLPEDNSYLPGSSRIYRRGENQGFDFYGNDAGTPIVFGQAVIAAADGVIKRADTVYTELSSPDWQALLTKVSNQGATEEELDLLRGRQLEVSLADGRMIRYAHLSGIHPNITEGSLVYRGQVIGFVGNSGTDDGIEGTTRGARLHFEVWQADGRFFGMDLANAAQVRDAANALFVGP